MSQLLLGLGIGFVFFNKANTKSFETSKREMDVKLEMIISHSSSQFNNLGKNLSLLSASSAFSNLNAIEISSSLKSYRVSSLFLAGEKISAYNSLNRKIADNKMFTIIDNTKVDSITFFEEVKPAHLYVGENRWSSGIPHRILGVTVPNSNMADGVLTAEFSYRRLYDYWREHTRGDDGFLAVMDEKGRLVYYPDLSKLRKGIYVKDINPEWNSLESIASFEESVLNNVNDKSYSVSYKYDNDAKLGFFIFKSRSEILSSAFDLVFGLFIALGIALLVSLFTTLLVAKKISAPISVLAENMLKLSDGNLEVRTGIDQKDEIGMLGRGFDTMAGSLKQKVDELAQHREHLEEEVKDRTRQLQKSNEELERLSRTDPLTGLSNRRDLLEKINYETHRIERSKLEFAFILLDVDNFKNFNDSHGHECGDEVLKVLSDILLDVKRKPDHVGRWGGEEFLVVLPETNLAQASLAANRIRRRVEETKILWKEEELSISVTLGVSLYDHDVGVDGSIDLADKRLYIGKESGRNIVISEGAVDL